MQRKKLVIFDANAVIHRAYHALPSLTTKKGEAVNAVYGFLLLFFKVVREMSPDFVVACFDFPGPTFRHKKFKEYKATRPKIDEELKSQIPIVKEFLKAFKIPVLEKEGLEADDILGTIAATASGKNDPSGLETTIVTGDADALQLVNRSTKVYLLRRGLKDASLYGEENVKEKYGGLTPRQLVDFKGLKGDSSDNIPGVKGIGDKTALELLNKFGSLERVFEEAAKNNPFFKPAVLKKLIRGRGAAFLSRDLAKINTGADVGFSLRDARFGEYGDKEAAEIISRYEFFSLIKRLGDLRQRPFVNANLSLW